ncbi:MAG: FliI/YscN family ATPase [Bdellovibrionota bacterium]
MSIHLASLATHGESPSIVKEIGNVESIAGGMILSRMKNIQLGELCYIQNRLGNRIPAQVVAFSRNECRLAPLNPLIGISPNDTIIATGAMPLLTLPHNPCGKVYDSLGEPLDVEPSHHAPRAIAMEIEGTVPTPLSRPLISEQMRTGIRAIDLCCPIGFGQRIGLFAGPGVGKSTLLGMIAKNASVDRIVISLVGERGREVREFIEESLGTEGLQRSIIIVSTSDEPPIRRKLAAMSATRIAEYFRDRGERVLLLVDSLTRTARAIRDVSLSVGELPVRQGYTASVFEELPRILERAGTGPSGSITAIYTILAEALEEQDILSEEMKSLLDGHIVLDRNLAQRGLFPAINVTKSLSRLTPRLLSNEERPQIRTLFEILHRLRNDKELLQLGGVADEKLKFCIEREQELIDFFHHGICAKLSHDKSDKAFLKRLHEQYIVIS